MTDRQLAISLPLHTKTQTTHGQKKMQSTAKGHLPHQATTGDGCSIPLGGGGKDSNDRNDSNHAPEDTNGPEPQPAAPVSVNDSSEIAAQPPLVRDSGQLPASKFWELIQASASAKPCGPTATTAHTLTQLPLPPPAYLATVAASGAFGCPCACPFCPIDVAAPGGVCSVSAGPKIHTDGTTASSSCCAENGASGVLVVGEDGEEDKGYGEARDGGQETNEVACQDQSPGNAPDTNSGLSTMCQGKDENDAPTAPPPNTGSTDSSNTGVQPAASSPSPLPPISYFFEQQYREEYTGQEWTEDKSIPPVYAENDDAPPTQWYPSVNCTDDDTSYREDCVMFWSNPAPGALPTIIEEGAPLVDVSADAGDGSPSPYGGRIVLASWSLEQEAAELYYQSQSPPSLSSSPSPSPSPPSPISGVFTDPVWWVDQELVFSPPPPLVHYYRGDMSDDGGAPRTSTSPSIRSAGSGGCGGDSPARLPSLSISSAASEAGNGCSCPGGDWGPSNKSTDRSDAQPRPADGGQYDSEIDSSLPQKQTPPTRPHSRHALSEEGFTSGEETPIALDIPIPGSDDVPSVHSGRGEGGESGCPWPSNAGLRRYFRRVINKNNRNHDMKKGTKKEAKASKE